MVQIRIYKYLYVCICIKVYNTVLVMVSKNKSLQIFIFCLNLYSYGLVFINMYLCDRILTSLFFCLFCCTNLLMYRSFIFVNTCAGL